MGQAMTCKKCGGEMRLWLLRPGFKSFACASCEFATIAGDDSPKPNDRRQDDGAGLRS
jgi:ssDNA-binding Zn-finger/Zn-ribbon topoisomerase 1